MRWTEPRFSRSEVDRAGELLANTAPSARGTVISDIEDTNEVDDANDALLHALDVVNNWRASHGYPLQVVRNTLRARALKAEPNALVAQRRKRVPAILAKLRRFDSMKLSQMQDIGGCRAVVDTIDQVLALARRYESADGKGRRERLDRIHLDDYLHYPKPDGYSSVHLIYKYHTESAHHRAHNKQRIEIQLRSRLQHAWATAVETVDAATQQALKSNIGEEQWKRFFALASCAFAIRERRPTVPGMPTRTAEIADELRELNRTLAIEAILGGMGTAIRAVRIERDADARGIFQRERNKAYLLTLDIRKGLVSIAAYAPREMAEADADYAKAEFQMSGKLGTQVVLASVDSLEELGQAFPNFFLHAQTFVEAFREIVGAG